MKTEYTVNGQTYDLLIQDGSIILQSLTQDLIYEHGWEKCKDAAEDYLKHNAYDDYGKWIGYSSRAVEEVANDFIGEFVKSESYTVVKHELN